MSVTTGREVLGYPKTWGWPSRRAGRPLRLTLRAFGLDYGPTSRAAMHPLLEIVSDQPHAEDPGTALDSLPELARYIAATVFERRGRAIVLPGFEFSSGPVHDLHR